LYINLKKIIHFFNNSKFIIFYKIKNQRYYIEVISSKEAGGLNLALNAKMLDSTLNTKFSSYVYNEIQEIALSSTVVSESNV
jgi:hypothetical protein